MMVSNMEDTMFWLQTKRLGDGLGHVDIIADRSLAVFGIEFSRSVRKLHTGGKLAVLHQIAGRNQLGQLVNLFLMVLTS